jgi:hypothetical protein
MFGRYETDKSGAALPVDWTEGLIRALTENYYAQSEKDNRFFDVFGRIFEKEFLLIASYVHHEDQLKSPISIVISCDIIADQKKFQTALSEMVDLLGHIFDDIFATQDWNGYIQNWTENTYKTNTFYYKITRENIALTLQANEILEKDETI